MAEVFPDLYRTILDGIAQLERSGHRAEAYRIRLAAAAAYSSAWSEAGHRRLLLVAARLERDLAAPDAMTAGHDRRRPTGGPLAVLLRQASSR